MKAVILAGGEGTRLRPLTYTRPKPMIPFLNKPVLEHIIVKLEKQGFDDMVITTNYMVETMRDYFGDGSKWGVKLHIVNEDEPLGTAGSVKNAVKYLDGTFAVIQGDNISEIDVRKLYDEHKKLGGMFTISLMEVDDVSLFGIAEMDDHRIVKYMEKPKKEQTFSKLANDGIYILEPEVLDMIPLAFYDFSRGLFPKMLEEGKKICGVLTHDFWRDIGTPKDYLEATDHYLKGENLIAKGCLTDGADIHESVLGANCSVTDCNIKNSVLFDNVKIGNASKLKTCIIGENTVLGDNVDIWPGAVVGDNCEIADNAVLKGDARVGPNTKIGSETVSGVIRD